MQEVELRRALGDRLAEGDGLRWLSRLSWFNIRKDEAVAYGEQAVALLETLPEGRELAMALSNVAQLSMLAFDDDEAVRRGERALELAERLGDLETRIHALNNIGSARPARRRRSTSATRRCSRACAWRATRASRSTPRAPGRTSAPTP